MVVMRSGRHKPPERSSLDCENPGRGEQKKCVIQHANVSITTEVIRFTLVGQSDSEVRRPKPGRRS